jgi:hypothetical protein
VEREPITDANRDQAQPEPDISEEEYELVLTEERPVVHKETVPVERVKLAKESITEDHQVSEQVRKEQIETEGDGPGTRGQPTLKPPPQRNITTTQHKAAQPRRSTSSRSAGPPQRTEGQVQPLRPAARTGTPPHVRAALSSTPAPAATPSGLRRS